MLLAAEIGLTVAAWRRGWKGWALLPFGVALGIGFLIGAIMGASGASEGSIFASAIAVDVLCVGTLAGMVAKPRRAGQSLGYGQTREVSASEVQ